MDIFEFVDCNAPGMTYWPRHSIGGFNKRIINGKNAELYDIPSQVGIFVLINNEWNLLCGGVLIKPDKVLTAAHCMEGKTVSNVKVSVGMLNSHGPPTQYEQLKCVTKIKTHEDYVDLINDLAILALDTPVMLNKNVKVAQLADDSSDFVDTPCIISGWGASNNSENAFPNRLQKTSVMLLSQEDCLYYWSEETEGINNKEFVCVASKRDDSSSCNGDSGGPLLCGPNLDKLVGVCAIVVAGCPKDFPFVYTDVTQYHRSWIEKNS
ncbi:fibrinolytic enzyme, isozyme C-like [Biomphalaria glabrata]|uniref:Fibrinolytic enzyme, isozyme C-like n=1 Tax=Biomphalaria glabrata TaxID=6526 RepID=A0A9W3AWY5_BIOGL|nr:fibrinolytic enzyme, isozyme C-like [Biomphalaria glabrata]